MTVFSPQIVGVVLMRMSTGRPSTSVTICPSCGRLQRPRLVKDGKLYLVNLSDEQMATLQTLFNMNL